MENLLKMLTYFPQKGKDILSLIFALINPTDTVNDTNKFLQFIVSKS